METERYIALIHRKLSNQISESDRIELENWYRESPENAELYQGVRTLWQSLQPQESRADFNLQQSWDGLESALGLQDRTELPAPDFQGNRGKRKRLQANQSIRYWAAAAVILMVVAVLTLMQYNGSDQSIRYITRNGESHIYDLPDGSSVHLNNASEVRIANHFGASERRIELKGEAFFEIKRDPIPCVVTTENAEIRVLGTSFYVQSIAQGTKVVVSRGTVEFLNRDKNTEPNIILTANQASHCVGDMPAQPPQEVNAADFLGWREGKLIYKERSLAEIILDLERTYDITIETSGSVSTAEVVSGWFYKEEGPEFILRTVCSTLGLKFSKKNRKFVITNEV
jgi:ferric-dicitrate binding protein FerR (iron transport regulator)